MDRAGFDCLPAANIGNVGDQLGAQLPLESVCQGLISGLSQAMGFEGTIRVRLSHGTSGCSQACRTGHRLFQVIADEWS